MKTNLKLLSALLAIVTLLSFAGCAFVPGPTRDPSATKFQTAGVITHEDTDEPEETTAADITVVTDEPTEETTEEVTEAATEEVTTKKKKEKKTEKVTETEKQTETEKPAIDKNGSYTKKDDVALYIHTYGKLPNNFITKKEAEKLGWSGGGLDKYANGKCIGGDRFGNYEGLLPKKKGRTYTECDIDTMHKSSRGAKRIIFSNDGLIYYTDDHYESFTLLYGEE